MQLSHRIKKQNKTKQNKTKQNNNNKTMVFSDWKMLLKGWTKSGILTAVLYKKLSHLGEKIQNTTVRMQKDTFLFIIHHFPLVGIWA